MVFKKSYQRGCFDRRLANHLEMPRKKKRHKKYRSKVKKKHAEAYQATSRDCKDADVTIWTDGSCVASQFGPGAWSFILRSDEKEIEASGYDPHTTVNRMEMMAAVEGLKRCPEGVAALVISDSMLLVKCGSGEWKRKANLDLWSLLDEQMKNRSVVFRWVRSHNGDEMNERCDTLCGQARRSKLGGITEKTLVKKEENPLESSATESHQERPAVELSLVMSSVAKWSRIHAYLAMISEVSSAILSDPEIQGEELLKESVSKLSGHVDECIKTVVNSVNRDMQELLGVPYFKESNETED